MNNTLLQDELALIAAALGKGAVVLVPNHRSSQQLQDAWSRWQCSLLHTRTVPTPAIRAVDLWCTELWQDLSLQLTSPVLGWHILQPAEELLLWRKIIAGSAAGRVLLNPEGTAGEARDTWRVLQLACVKSSDLRAALAQGLNTTELPDDRQVYLQWLEAFVSLCQKQQLLTFGDVLQILLNWSNDEPALMRRHLPDHIALRGFDDPPVLYAQLFAAFAQTGVSFATVQPDSHVPAIQVCSFTLATEECRAVVQFTRDILAVEPAARIGIICPDLKQQQSTLERMFSQTFTAAHNTPTVAWSATDKLSDEPFVATALQLLELNDATCDTQLLCELLRSPWLLGASEEADARANLESRLRRQGEIRSSLATLRSSCMLEPKPCYSPLLGRALLAFEQLRVRQREEQAPLQWLQLFQQQLALLLDRDSLSATGNSGLLQDWDALLDKCMRSAFLFETCTLEVARNLLACTARETRLTVRNTEATIKVLSPVEGAGQHFTHLWCMQLLEQHWPGDSHPNPWLPLQLQKAHALPGADPGLALAKSRQLLQSLISATSTVVMCSYAQYAEDLPQQPSQLLPAVSADANSWLIPVLQAADLHPAVLQQPLQQTVADKEQMFVPPAAGQTLHGPGSLLADQAACPFRAFALHRLHVTELQELHYGLSPAAVGNLVHLALQYFWQALQNSEQLLATPSAELSATIRSAVLRALRETASLYPHTMTPRYQQVAQEHLQRLLTAWLEQEMARGHFAVLENEKRLQWRCAQLELKLRIDRIDRTADGDTVLVDYKTGRPGSINWEETRPQAPQLLLYQQAVEQAATYAPVTALLYARVNLEEVKYSGIGADEQVLPFISFSDNRYVSSTSWEALKAHWSLSLQALAQEYLDGYAAVQPYSRKSCEYCHLPSFCRIAESRKAE